MISIFGQDAFDRKQLILAPHDEPVGGHGLKGVAHVLDELQLGQGQSLGSSGRSASRKATGHYVDL
ncbi:hypothetical protein ES703_66971 [subsurface metagenome]